MITDNEFGIIIFLYYCQVFLYVDPSDVATVDHLQQFYILCPDHVKDAYLVQLIRLFKESNENGSIIIFTDTCR